MTKAAAERARHCAVPTKEPLIGDGDYDYADAFEIHLDRPDGGSVEQLFRRALQRARWIQATVPIVHRLLLGFRLGPLSSLAYLLGWTIVVSEPDVFYMRAEGPLMKGAIVGRKNRERALFTSYLFFERPALARGIWAVTGPLHRRVAPHLLECAVAARSTGSSTTAADGAPSPHNGP